MSAWRAGVFGPTLVLFAGAGAGSKTTFDGTYYSGAWSGSDDSDYLSLLDASRRAFGESTVDSFRQSVPMLYSGSQDGLLEGPTWAAWWTQNSYGTTMASLPFLPDVTMHALSQSQNWWFNNMADGKHSAYPDASASQGWAPDGMLCDNGSPQDCNYKQGDEDVPIHDWTLEESLSALVMQAELLLITRNASGIRVFLPLFLRTSNLIESRRDPATSMTTFLSGPSSNLLAPSFAGWRLDNGRHAWSYLTGITITYSAALDRAAQCAQIVGDGDTAALLTARRGLNTRGFGEYLSPSGDYFVRSVDPNGTLHGVIGQDRFGYFEASPNHDAVAFRVVNDSVSRSIVDTIMSLKDRIRPNIFILPNTDAKMRAAEKGSGATGYDDLPCGDADSCGGGLWEFGRWVNGGVWTTTEARWILAAARTNATEVGQASVREMINNFGNGWRMDNPLVDFGQAPYQPDEDINLTVDAFGASAAFVRGLFEYIYAADQLLLVPHFPDNLTSLEQRFGIRWGPYRIWIQSKGIRSSGIASVSLNGVAISSFNTSSVALRYEDMPTASPNATRSVESPIRTTSMRVDVAIVFRDIQGFEAADVAVAIDKPTAAPSPNVLWNCSEFAAGSYAPSRARLARLRSFVDSAEASGNDTRDTVPTQMARLAVSYTSAFLTRCEGINNGTIAPLRSANATRASLVQLLTTATSLSVGVDNLFAHVVERELENDPVAVRLKAIWGASAMS